MVTSIDCGIMNIVVYGNDNIQHIFLMPIYYSTLSPNILNLVDLFYKNGSLQKIYYKLDTSSTNGYLS